MNESSNSGDGVRKSGSIRRYSLTKHVEYYLRFVQDIEVDESDSDGVVEDKVIERIETFELLEGASIYENSELVQITVDGKELIEDV
jgi:hypothetical protein